tara:strand:- start:769 stop:1065 length:297 start_codon:yes stop_codon:yes gene_type:complete
MNSNITASDYSFVENESEDFYGVKLTSGMWPNVIVVYGKVSIKESPEIELATLSFTYNIQDSAKFQPTELEKDEAFNNYLGEILTHIVCDQVERQVGS